MNPYPPQLHRLLRMARLARENPVERPAFADSDTDRDAPPHGFATRVAALWIAQPKAPAFSYDLERFSRWGAAAAIGLCFFVAGFRPRPAAPRSEAHFDFFGVESPGEFTPR